MSRLPLALEQIEFARVSRNAGAFANWRHSFAAEYSQNLKCDFADASAASPHGR